MERRCLLTGIMALTRIEMLMKNNVCKRALRRLVVRGLSLEGRS